MWVGHPGQGKLSLSFMYIVQFNHDENFTLFISFLDYDVRIVNEAAQISLFSMVEIVLWMVLFVDLFILGTATKALIYICYENKPLLLRNMEGHR